MLCLKDADPCYMLVQAKSLVNDVSTEAEDAIGLRFLDRNNEFGFQWSDNLLPCLFFWL